MNCSTLWERTAGCPPNTSQVGGDFVDCELIEFVGKVESGLHLLYCVPVFVFVEQKRLVKTPGCVCIKPHVRSINIYIYLSTLKL